MLLKYHVWDESEVPDVTSRVSLKSVEERDCDEPRREFVRMQRVVRSMFAVARV